MLVSFLRLLHHCEDKNGYIEKPKKFACRKSSNERSDFDRFFALSAIFYRPKFRRRFCGGPAMKFSQNVPFLANLYACDDICSRHYRPPCDPLSLWNCASTVLPTKPRQCFIVERSLGFRSLTDFFGTITRRLTPTKGSKFLLTRPL